jgi:hypothetical protein
MSYSLPAIKISSYLFGNAAPARKFVKFASTTGINLALAGPYSVDGTNNVNTVGDRVLLKDQSTASENGIYVYNGTNLVRAPDALVGTPFAAVQVNINQGTTNVNKQYVCSAPSGTDIIGTDALPFLANVGISQVDTGTGLTGGPIFSTGTISMADMNAYTYKSNITTATAAPADNLLSDLRLTLTKIFYVNNVTGNDSTNSGISSSEAFFTVNKALGLLTGTGGQIIMANTGSVYSFAPTLIPENAMIRFSTTPNAINDYSGWTNIIASSAVASVTIDFITNSTGSTNVATIIYGLGSGPLSTLTRTQVIGNLLTWTSGVYTGQSVLILDYFFISMSEAYFVILGDWSSANLIDNFTIYQPPVTIFNNGAFSNINGRHTSVIFSGVQFSPQAAYSYASTQQRLIFEYSRYTNELQLSQSFLVSDGALILRNSGWSSGSPFFDFSQGNMDVEFLNSVVNLTGSIAAGRLGMTNTSNSRFIVDSSAVVLGGVNIPWQLVSTDTSITNSLWVGALDASNCSSITLNNNTHYMGTYYTTPSNLPFTPSLITSAFADCSVSLNNIYFLHHYVSGGPSVPILAFSGGEINFEGSNNVTFINGPAIPQAITVDTACRVTSSGSLNVNTAIYLLQITDNAEWINTGTLTSPASSCVNNIVLGNQGSFTSTASLSSFNGGTSAVIYDITAGTSITASALNNYALPYTFASVDRISSSRYGVAPIVSSSLVANQQQLLGNGAWRTNINNPLIVVKGTVTSANITLGSFASGSSAQGITFNTGDLILLTSQSNAVENGVYQINSTAPPTRPLSAPSGTAFGGHSVVSQEGNQPSPGIWMCTNPSGSDVIDTDALSFSRTEIGNTSSVFYTADGTYTHQTGNDVYVTCWGGGGGGGSSYNDSVVRYIGGGGGGGGIVTSYPISSLMTNGLTYSIVIGYQGFSNDTYTDSNLMYAGAGGATGIIFAYTTQSGTLSGLTQSSTSRSTIACSVNFNVVAGDVIYVMGSPSYIFKIEGFVAADNAYVWGSTVYTGGGGINKILFSGRSFAKVTRGIIAFGGGGGDSWYIGAGNNRAGSGGTNDFPGIVNTTTTGVAGCPSAVINGDAQFGGNFFTAGAGGGIQGDFANSTLPGRGGDVYGKWVGGEAATGTDYSYGGGGGAGYFGPGGTYVGIGVIPLANSGAGGAGATASGVSGTYVQAQNGGSGGLILDIQRKIEQLA